MLHPLYLLRTFKGAPGICLLALHYSQSAQSAAWLEQMTGYSRNTVAKALATLARFGLVVRVKSSWKLAEGVSALVTAHDSHRSDLHPTSAGQPAELLAPDPDSAPAPFQQYNPRGEASSPQNIFTYSIQPGHDPSIYAWPSDPPAQNPSDGDEILSSELDQMNSGIPNRPTHDAQGAPDCPNCASPSTPPAQEPSSSAESSLPEVGDPSIYASIPAGVPSNRASLPADSQSLKSEAVEDTVPPDSDSQTQLKFPDADDSGRLEAIARILAASAALFGEPVHGPPARYPDPNLLLASIAEAYDRRDRLRKPVRVVFANLKNGAQPAPRYLSDPLAYLPDEFLKRAGYPFFERPPTYRGWTNAPDYPGAPDTPEAPELLPAPHASLNLTIDPDGRYTATQAWALVRRILSLDLQSDAYRRRIAPLSLALYTPAPPTFVLAAPDEETCAWLRARYTRLLERHLSGVCRQPAQVEFVLE